MEVACFWKLLPPLQKLTKILCWLCIAQHGLHTSYLLPTPQNGDSSEEKPMKHAYTCTAMKLQQFVVGAIYCRPLYFCTDSCRISNRFMAHSPVSSGSNTITTSSEINMHKSLLCVHSLRLGTNLYYTFFVWQNRSKTPWGWVARPESSRRGNPWRFLYWGRSPVPTSTSPGHPSHKCRVAGAMSGGEVASRVNGK